jgi:hypothetical protein
VGDTPLRRLVELNAECLRSALLLEGCENVLRAVLGESRARHGEREQND